MPTSIERVKLAIQDLQQGKMIILVDAPSRENEGDLVCAAEKITPEAMNFMVRHTSGIVCLSLPEAQVKKLGLTFMVPPSANTSARCTPFVTPIDAKQGITSGVSASDRVTTIQTAIATAATPDDVVKPGHIFPLQASAGGVLERAGHTEGSLDLMYLAGLTPAAVLCEVMNADGTMAQGHQLEAFAEEYQLRLLSIEDVIAYRLQ